jgi:hypothetical protein
MFMEVLHLADQIHGLRNSDRASQIIFPGRAKLGSEEQPSGVLLLKPSSGAIPVSSLLEILKRLTVQYGYAIRAAVWWHGRDVKAQGLMSLHYPGFHRVAHGGLRALAPEVLARLRQCYAGFEQWYGKPFHLGLVRTPYDLAECGLSFERANQWWELDRAGESAAIKCVQRLDEDTLCVAMPLGANADVPSGLREQALVLLNGFYGKLEQDFEAKGCVALWIQRQSDASASWEQLRSRYAGKTNPFLAPPDTVRGDAARGVLPVEMVSVLANVIHLSADEVEGRREVSVWWDPGRFSRVFGTDWMSA